MLKYDSPEFWNVLAPWVRYVTAYGGAAVCCWENQPIKPYDIWLNAGGRYATASVPDIDPATIPPWEESLIERPYVWQVPNETTPIDTPCLARDFVDNVWLRRYSAGFENGVTYCWDDGKTAWSSGGLDRSVWTFIVLADPNNPDRVPPADWKPEATNET